MHYQAQTGCKDPMCIVSIVTSTCLRSDKSRLSSLPDLLPLERVVRSSEYGLINS
jgi:hypothetical protein